MSTKNPCPFCGAIAATHVLNPDKLTNHKGYQIECINCGSRGPSGMATPKDAKLAWDRGDPPYIRHGVE